MPDNDAAVAGRDHGVGIAAAGQEPEQGGSWPDRSEEAQVAGLHGQAGEEGLQRSQIAGAHRPDQAGVWAAGRALLGSAHRLSVCRIAESVKQTYHRSMEEPWILDYDTANCAIGAATAIIGERTTFLVLREIFGGVRRFDDIQRRTGAPRQVLSDRLARPVPGGVLRKGSYQQDRLTDKGLDLYPVLVALMHWGDRYEGDPAGPPVLLTHRDCGEPVRLQLSCDAGHTLPSAREVTPLPGPGARKSA